MSDAKNDWAWLQEIAPEPVMLTPAEIALALSKIENELGERPVQVVGPRLEVRWRVGDDLLTAGVQYLRRVDGVLKGKFAVSVSDYASHDSAEHLWLKYQSDPEFHDEFDRPYLWNMRVCEADRWVRDLLPSVQTWDAFKRGFGTAWANLAVQLQMLPVEWFDSTITCTDSWGSIELEFSRNGLRARKVTVTGPDAEDELDLRFTAETAWEAGPLLAEQFASNFAPDFPFTDLDFDWAPARDFHGAYVPDHPRDGARPCEGSRRASDLIVLAHHATGVRTAHTSGFPSAPLELRAGEFIDLSALPVPTGSEPEPTQPEPIEPEPIEPEPSQPEARRPWWRFWQ